MERKNNVMVTGGQYKKGTIILKGGQVIDAKDLIAAKKAGIPANQLMAYLNKKEELVAKEVEQEVAVAKEEKPRVQWASIPREEIRAAGYVKDPVKEPWYKRLFKKGDNE
jgi:hypothetical protein